MQSIERICRQNEYESVSEERVADMVFEWYDERLKYAWVEDVSLMAYEEWL